MEAQVNKYKRPQKETGLQEALFMHKISSANEKEKVKPVQKPIFF